MSDNLVALLRDARALATALRRAICTAGLTQTEAGAFVGVDARRVRRWLSGEVSLRTVELLLRLREQQIQGAVHGAQGDPATCPQLIQHETGGSLKVPATELSAARPVNEVSTMRVAA